MRASVTLFAVLFATASLAEPRHLAVLEFEVAPGLKIDRTYFSDLARAAVHRRAPQIFVMTRESTEVLLQAAGKTAADCLGNCEIEVGRKLGADFIVSGRISQIGTYLTLSLRLFSTADGQLLDSAEARGKSEDELLEKSDQALAALTQPLGALPPPEPPVASSAPASEPARRQEGAGTEAAARKPPAAEAAPGATSSAAAPAPGAPPSAPGSSPSAGQQGVAMPGPAPRAGLPAEVFEAAPAAPARPSRARGWLLLGAGALLAGGSAAFDNLSSTSKDNKLGAADFLPVAGYALALALGSYGVLQLVKP